MREGCRAKLFEFGRKLLQIIVGGRLLRKTGLLQQLFIIEERKAAATSAWERPELVIDRIGLLGHVGKAIALRKITQVKHLLAHGIAAQILTIEIQDIDLIVGHACRAKERGELLTGKITPHHLDAWMGFLNRLNQRFALLLLAHADNHKLPLIGTAL
jgi:hypothetical protein